MNRTELIKKLQAMTVGKPSLSAPARTTEAGPEIGLENTLNILTGQSPPAWRPVSAVGKVRATLSADPDRCKKCHYAKMQDGFCVFQDRTGTTGWQHHYRVTATCKALPSKPSLDRDTAPCGVRSGKQGGKEKKEQRGVLIARDFWRENLEKLKAAGFVQEDFFGPCRAGVSPLAGLKGWETAERVEIKGKFVCFFWTVEGRSIMQRAAAEHRVRCGNGLRTILSSTQTIGVQA